MMARPENNSAQPKNLRVVDDNLAEATADPEQERIELSGRAGTDPVFRSTARGTLVARFPLAVHDDSDKTTWHQIVAFNERAEALKDIVSRGAAVAVVGYLHQREVTTADGESKTLTEVYVATVTAVEPKKSVKQ